MTYNLTNWLILNQNLLDEVLTWCIKDITKNSYKSLRFDPHGTSLESARLILIESALPQEIAIELLCSLATARLESSSNLKWIVELIPLLKSIILKLDY